MTAGITINDRIRALEAAVKLARELHTDPSKVKQTAKVFYEWVVKENEENEQNK